MKITRIKSATDMAVFRNYSYSTSDTDLKKLNVIYGFNGSGKTTLSRIFRSMEKGNLSSMLPPNSRFQVELSDGTVVTSERNLGRLASELAVFNSDFIEENFRWKDGSARAVFYIGREQAETAAELEACERKLEATRAKQLQAVDLRGKAYRAFASFKTETARLIGEQINYRTFNARHLEAEYSKGDRGTDCLLTDMLSREAKAVILQDEPLPKVMELPREEFGAGELVDHFDQIKTCLSKSVAGAVIKELELHPSMMTWVGTGHEYHVKHKLANCLYCGNQLTLDRRTLIEATINLQFISIADETDRLLAQTQVMYERLSKSLINLPSKNDLMVDRSTYDRMTDEYRESIKGVLSRLKLLELQLQEKKLAPQVLMVLGSGHAESILSLVDAVQDKLGELNALIARHNRSHDEFAAKKVAAQRNLLEHHLALSCSSYRQHEKELMEADTALQSIDNIVNQLGKEVEFKRQKLRSHGTAATEINRLITAYLRHNEIDILAQDDGFQLRRHGAVASNLSEGEKTAIALCYFLSTLSSDGKQLKNRIVVIDDPVSSLDSKALNYAFGLLKSYVSKSEQAIILTHNIHFMNECRKWLKSKVGNGEAAMLFLNLRSVKGVRQTCIEKLPKLLREYDSEYHYLFCLVKRFADGECGEHTLLMPNAMRKVLEIFLTFKRPGGEWLGNKVEALSDKAGQFGLDGSRIRALERLVQVESHGDSLDDLITFSEMTVEEVLDSATALMDVISKLDPEHYERQCKMCK